MKTRSIMVAILLAAAFAASPATAGSGSGLISNFSVTSGYNVAVFTLTPVQTPLPACATSARFAFSLSTPVGQATMALLLTAYAQGKKVNIVGTGVCDVWSDSESISYVISP